MYRGVMSAKTDGRLKCYYAHCVAIYGTPQEERDMVTLRALGLDVKNPNQPEIQKAYLDLPQEDRMQMFKNRVLECAVFAFRANPDGSIPSGVHKELKWAMEGNLLIIELPNGLLRRGLTYELTKEFLHDCGER